MLKENYFIMQEKLQTAPTFKFGNFNSFNINDNIIEHILHFAYEGWWMGDMYSF
jgi:hypothetical protein